MLNHLGMAVGSRKFQSLQRDWLWYSLNAWRVEAEKMKGLQAPSNWLCLNPKGLLNGTPHHQFGTPWRVQV